MNWKEKVKLKWLDLKDWYDNLNDMEKVQTLSIAALTIAGLIGQFNAIYDSKRRRSATVENQTVRRDHSLS